MSKPALPAAPVPQDVTERHENEWRQMQSRAGAPKSAAQTIRD